MTTDTTEKGLENLIMRHLTGVDGLAVPPNTLSGVSPPFGGAGCLASSAQDFDRAHALDAHQLFAFLQATQPDALKKLDIANLDDPKDLNRIKFLTRVSSEIGKRGIKVSNTTQRVPSSFTSQRHRLAMRGRLSSMQ